MSEFDSESSSPARKKQRPLDEIEAGGSNGPLNELNGWSEGDLRTLLDRIEAIVPKKDHLSFQTRTKHIDWNKVAFDEHSVEDCKEAWMHVLKSLRHFRTAVEMVQEFRNNLDHPVTKNNKHPAKPKQAQNAFMLFCNKYRQKFKDEHPGVPSNKLVKMIGEAFRNLPPEKREKWEKKAEKAKILQKEQMDEFYKEYPDEAVPQGLKKLLKDKSKTVTTEGPKKPRSPLEVYVEERKKEDSPQEIVRLKEKWETISNKKKAKWIKLALLEQHKYENELKAYISNHPKFKAPRVRNFVTKEDIKILEEVYGRPSKPPQSGYQLFTKNLLQDEEMENVAPTQKLNFCASQWKNLSEVKKQEYNEQLKQLWNEYDVQLKQYLDRLSDEERVLEEAVLRRKPEKVVAAPKKRKRKPETAEEEPQTKTLSEILENEPKTPPASGLELFCADYEGEEPVEEAWSALSKKDRKEFEKTVAAMRKVYDKDYDKFLKSMTRQQMERYIAFQKSKERSN